MPHPDIHRLRLAARGQTLPPLDTFVPEDDRSAPPGPPVPPRSARLLARVPAPGPTVRRVGSLGLIATALVAALCGLQSGWIGGVIIVGFANTMWQPARRHGPRPIDELGQYWGEAAVRLSLWAGTIGACLLALWIVAVQPAWLLAGFWLILACSPRITGREHRRR